MPISSRWRNYTSTLKTGHSLTCLKTITDIGATRIRGLNCYTIGGKDLVYYGEGTGGTKVFVYDASNNSVTTLSVPAAAGDIALVKLSGITTANPKMYVLVDSGKLVIYSLASTGKALASATPLKIFDTAALSALAGTTDWASGITRVYSSFEVTDDGKTAFLIAHGNNNTDGVNPKLRVIYNEGDVDKNAKIIHSPAVALATGDNPSAVQGASWTVGRRIWWNDSTLSTAGLSFVANWADGLSGIATSAGGVPCVLANNTSAPITSNSIMGNPASTPFVAIDPIAPGEIVLHPECYSETLLNRVVLRFHVPRNGVYSLSAVFRALNGLQFVSVAADVTVLLDGTILYQTELTHPDNVTRKKYSFDKMYLTTGQTIDIVVGSGLTETGNAKNPSHQGDGVGVVLSIVEENGSIDPIADDWDFSTAFAAEAAKASPAVPFAADDASSGAQWSICNSTAANFFYEYSTTAVMAKWATDAVLDGKRVSVAGTANETEHVTVYNPAATASALAGLGTYVPTGGSTLLKYPDRVGPGEVTMHPDNNDKCVFVRFIVPTDGRYVASYAMRDISRDSSCVDHDGVSVSVLAGSVFMGESSDLSIEHGTPCDFRQFVTPPLKAGTAIDFRLGNRSLYNYDGTAGRIRVMRLADDAAVADDCAATALRANVTGANVNPCTSASGATWTLAKSTSALGAGFAAVTGKSTSTKLSDWHYTGSDSAYPNVLPYFNINRTLDSVDNAADTTIVSGQLLFPNEILLHPSNTSESSPILAAMRYTAKTRGVYSFDVTARDVHPAGNIWQTPKGKCGVEVYLTRPNDSYLAIGYASADANDAKCWANINSSLVYLDVGESVDMSIRPKGGRVTACDATAVYENVHVAAAPDAAMAAVDIRTTGASGRYVARGRVGWADQSWAKTAASGNTLKAELLKISSGVTRTVFELGRASGGAVTPSALGVNTLMDDGVVSTNATDAYTFTLTGLKPNVAYTLYLYGSTVSGGATPTFTVGGVTAQPTLTWSRTGMSDVAILEAQTDAQGVITGTFASDGDGSSAFCGLQMEGNGFKMHNGLTIIIR